MKVKNDHRTFIYNRSSKMNYFIYTVFIRLTALGAY